MTGDQKNIDKLFHDGLKRLHENAPAQAWSRLDGALDAAINRKKRMFFRLAAASVLILMAFGSGYFYASYLNQPAEVFTEEMKYDPGTENIQQANSERPASTIEEPAEPATSFQKIPTNPGQTNEDLPQDVVLFRTEELAASDGKEMESFSPTVGHETILTGGSIPEWPIHAMAWLEVHEISSFLPATRGFINTGRRGKEVYFLTPGFYQDDYGSIAARGHNKWSVGAQFAPTYSYREISQNYGSGLTSSQDAIETLNNIEDPLLSYAGGVDVGFSFSDRWSVQSGMYFSRIGQVNADALEFKKSSNELLLYAINTSTGKINVAFERVPANVKRINSPKDTIDMGGINDVKVIQNFDLFEIPLVIRYKFLNKKFSMNLAGGLSPAYLIGNQTILETENQKYDIGDAGNLNSMIMNTSLGMGFEYLITKQLSVNFEPTFKYALNPINNSSTIDYHPYYFSWFTGVRFKFY